MATIGEGVIKIKSDTSGFGAGITSALGSVGKVAAASFTVASTAAIGFGVASFAAAARVGEMDATLKALSKGNAATYASMQKTVGAIRASGIEAGVAQNLVAQFTRNQLDLSKATDLSRVAQDAAVISGRNSTEVLGDLVHGITTQNSLVLRNAGINVQAGAAMDTYAKSVGKSAKELTDSERSQAVLNAVIAAGIPIAGAYAAAMEEPGKVLRSFPRVFDDIKVSVGKPLVDAFGPTILAAYDFAKALSASLQPGGELNAVVVAIGEKLAAVVEPFNKFIDLAKDWVKAIKPEQVQKIVDAVSNIGPAFTGAGAGVFAMGAKSLPVIGNLLGGVNPLAIAFGAFALTSGDLRDSLGELLGTLVPVGKELLGLLVPALKGLLGAVLPLVPLIADFAKTLLGGLMGALTPILPVITKVAEILGGALVAALNLILPEIVKLIPVFTDLLSFVGRLIGPIANLAGILIGGLAGAIAVILPVVVDLVNMLVKNLAPIFPILVGVISKLAPVIIRLVEQGFKILVPVLTAVMKAIDALLPALMRIIDDALAALIPVLPKLVDAFLRIADVVAKVLVVALDSILPLLVGLLDALAPVIPIILDLVVAVVELAAEVLEALMPAIVAILPPLLKVLTDAILPLLPAILGLLPPIVELVRALTPLIVLVADLVGWVLKLITLALVPIIKVIGDVAAIIVNALVAEITGLIDWLGKAVGKFVGFKDTVVGVFNWIKTNWPLLLAIITGPIGLAVLAVVKNFDTIKAGIDKVIGWFKELPGKVVSALQSAVGVLFGWFTSLNQTIKDKLNIDLLDVGRRIIESLIKGITSKIGDVGDAIGGIAGKIKNALPFSPAKEGPLAGHGNPYYSGLEIAASLARGLAAGSDLVAAEMDSMLAMPTPSDLGSFGAGADGRGAAAGAGPSYVLNIYPQTLDEQGVLAAFHRLEMIGSLR